MLVGTVSSEACLCDTEADGFLVVRHHKACAHVTGEAQSSHVRNAPINASEQTETVSLASKVIGQSAFATASARLVRDQYLNRMQIAWEIPCQGGGEGPVRRFKKPRCTDFYSKTSSADDHSKK